MFRFIATLAVASLVAGCAQTHPPVVAAPALPVVPVVPVAPAVAPVPASPSVAQVFRQAPLPYPSDALEPVIDKTTMNIHYGLHHKAYYDALNNAAASYPRVASSTVEQLVATASRRTAVVRNNAGGIWNHAFFWSTMAPAGQRGAPSPALVARIRPTSARWTT